ncbi:hypothetical protein TcCL_NonESM03606 [Trypanosoma cruzi]|nr:hypothetical protein TcCL_NonESM03606 [Trypanosoma cruzi]
MADVEESLLELRRLIARARREGGGGTHGKENDNETPKGCQISVKELERRFAGLEEKLFREKGLLREQAQELHQRAKRRKRQQKKKYMFSWARAMGRWKCPSGDQSECIVR